MFRGTHVQHPSVTVLRGTEVPIESLDDDRDPTSAPLELWASGERVGPLPARLVPVPGRAPRGRAGRGRGQLMAVS